MAETEVVMPLSERPDPLPGAIRWLLAIVVVVLCIWGVMTRPRILAGIVVLLAFVLLMTKVLGDLMWNDSGPDGGRSQAPIRDSQSGTDN